MARAQRDLQPQRRPLTSSSTLATTDGTSTSRAGPIRHLYLGPYGGNGSYCHERPGRLFGHEIRRQRRRRTPPSRAEPTRAILPRLQLRQQRRVTAWVVPASFDHRRVRRLRFRRRRPVSQTGGTNTASYLTIGAGGQYQLTGGGTLQISTALLNQGVVNGGNRRPRSRPTAWSI